MIYNSMVCEILNIEGNKDCGLNWMKFAIQHQNYYFAGRGGLPRVMRVRGMIYIMCVAERNLPNNTRNIRRYYKLYISFTIMKNSGRIPSVF